MFGTTPRLNPLASQKQLLLTESELNRAQWSEEWQAMTRGICDRVRQATTLGAWASSAAMLLAGFMAWRRWPPAPATAKPSWFKKILKGVRLTSTIWLACRAYSQKEAST